MTQIMTLMIRITTTIMVILCVSNKQQLLGLNLSYNDCNNQTKMMMMMKYLQRPWY